MTERSITLNGYKWKIESEEEEREMFEAIMKVKAETIKRTFTAEVKKRWKALD